MDIILLLWWWISSDFLFMLTYDPSLLSFDDLFDIENRIYNEKCCMWLHRYECIHVTMLHLFSIPSHWLHPHPSFPSPLPHLSSSSPSHTSPFPFSTSFAVSSYLSPSFILSLKSAKIRRSPLRYAGLDTDPDVTYDRMPTIHFPIDGKIKLKREKSSGIWRIRRRMGRRG